MADRQQPTISQTGVWVDTQTGQVVESEPEEGKMLVPPGGEVDQRIQDDIDAARAAAPPVDESDVIDEDEADETADEGDSKSRRRQTAAKGKGTVADTTTKATE